VTDLTDEQKHDAHTFQMGKLFERKRIIDLLDNSPNPKSRFVNKDWLRRQVEK